MAQASSLRVTSQGDEGENGGPWSEGKYPSTAAPLQPAAFELIQNRLALFRPISHAARRVPFQQLQGNGSHKSRSLCLQPRRRSTLPMGLRLTDTLDAQFEQAGKTAGTGDGLERMLDMDGGGAGSDRTPTIGGFVTKHNHPRV